LAYGGVGLQLLPSQGYFCPLTSAGFGKKSCIAQCISVFFNKCALVLAKQLVGYVSNNRVKKGRLTAEEDVVWADVKSKSFRPGVGEKAF